jgi:chromosome segregation ATPase
LESSKADYEESRRCITALETSLEERLVVLNVKLRAVETVLTSTAEAQLTESHNCLSTFDERLKTLDKESKQRFDHFDASLKATDTRYDLLESSKAELDKAKGYLNASNETLIATNEESRQSFKAVNARLKAIGERNDDLESKISLEETKTIVTKSHLSEIRETLKAMHSESKERLDVLDERLKTMSASKNASESSEVDLEWMQDLLCTCDKKMKVFEDTVKGLMSDTESVRIQLVQDLYQVRLNFTEVHQSLSTQVEKLQIEFAAEAQSKGSDIPG